MILLATAAVTPLQAAVAAPGEQEGPAEFAIDVSEGFDENISGEPLVSIGAAKRGAGYDPTLILEAPTSGHLALASSALMNDEQGRAFWAATEDYIDLSWADVRVDAPYEIYRDKQLVTTVTTPYARIPATGGTGIFSVGTSVPVPEAEWTDEDKTVIANGGDEPREGHEWGFNVQVPNGSSFEAVQDAREVEQAAIASVTFMTIRHRAFIRPAYAPAPPVACEYSWPDKFGGDNRGFSPTAGTHRLMLQFRVSWDGSPGHGMTKEVSPTRVYSDAGQLISTKTASNANMYAGVAGGDVGFALVIMQFDVGNPYCAAGSIAADYIAQLTQQGSYYITGNHRNVPDHEIYIMTNNVTIPIHQSSSTNFACLVEHLCPKVGLNASS